VLEIATDRPISSDIARLRVLAIGTRQQIVDWTKFGENGTSARRRAPSPASVQGGHQIQRGTLYRVPGVLG